MKLINNTFNENKEIRGVSKEEILEIKSKLIKFKSNDVESAEIEIYLREKLKPEILEQYSNYLREIRKFCNQYLDLKTEPDAKKGFKLHYLTSDVLNEVKLITNDVRNIKSNSQNIAKFAKKNAFLDNYLKTVEELLNKSDFLISELGNSLEEDKNRDNYIHAWVEVNKIKGSIFRVGNAAAILEDWDETKEIYEAIERINKPTDQTKKRKKTKEVLTFDFNNIYQYLIKKHEDKIDFYAELLYLFCSNKIFEEIKLEEFKNLFERKEIQNNLNNLIGNIIKNLVENRLSSILNEIITLQDDYIRGDSNKKLDIESLYDDDLNIYLPKIVDLYFKSLDKKFKDNVENDSVEEEELINLEKEFSEKVNTLSKTLEELRESISENFNILQVENLNLKSLETIFLNLSLEIERKEDEYISYIKINELQRSREKIRKYISEKISETNNLIADYQNKASAIVREEFPQLKKISDILSEYAIRIKKIKEDVYNKIDSVKDKNLEIYQIIKQWEDNFNFNRKQLSFLLSILLNKIYKQFKDLIEQEEVIFENITDISKISADGENIKDLPLNFAISKYLADKLTEDELKERISELNSKVNVIKKMAVLYRDESSKLEEILSNKIKIREGISTSKIQCNVCRNQINLTRDQIIKCPFCGAIYHYLCVAFWLSKYNSCPVCQNNFLNPNSGLFQVD